MKRFLFSAVIVVCGLFLSIELTAQESVGSGNCGDGIDNDNDGLIDCYDPGCAGATNCAFVGNTVPACRDTPTQPLNVIVVREIWRTDSALFPIDSRQSPVIGDLDNDGIPEVVVKSQEVDDSLLVFNGKNGSIENVVRCPRIAIWNLASALGDTDADNRGEIYVLTAHDQGTFYGTANRRRLIKFEWNEGTMSYDSIWTSTLVGFNELDERWTPNLADFDQDGTAEVYLGNQIFSSATGAELVAHDTFKSMGRLLDMRAYCPDDIPGNCPNAWNISDNEVFSVAFDVLSPTTTVLGGGACGADCNGLELITGDTIYSVNLATGTLTARIASVHGFGDGNVSIADWNKDGNMDVISSHFFGTGGGSIRSIAVWTANTGASIGTFNYTGLPLAFPVRLGRIAVSDFDGDDALELGYVTLQSAGVGQVVAMDNDLTTTLWTKTVDDNSMRTGTTMFDFEGDGSDELIYRDEDSLYILNGATGAVKGAFLCKSGTRTEYPMVVDVDADGQSEIVCTCQFGEGPHENDGSAVADWVATFRSIADPWVPTRQVFNQVTWHHTQVNDDLTIPAVMQNQSIYADSVILNNFLVQSTLLLSDGIPTYEAPDHAVSQSLDLSDCGSPPNTIQVTVTSTNLGRGRMPQTSKISLYNGDPNNGGTLITTLDSVGTASLDSGEVGTMVVTIPDQGGTFVLWTVVNDDGSGNPISPSSRLAECDTANNYDFDSIDNCVANALPIELSFFQAKMREQSVETSWQTEVELNNDYFIVQRSANATDFENIGRVEGAGTYLGKRNYNLTDHDPLPGLSYYRLKQVDFDGSHAYSSIVPVLNEASLLGAGHVNLYPNPVTDELNIKWSGSSIEAETVYVQIVNLVGQVADEFTVDLKEGSQLLSRKLDLPSGIYLVNIERAGEKTSRKIIIE